MSHYKQILTNLSKEPKTWLVTGVAGFIGSNLLETLLTYNQNVIGLDNFSTGYQHNLDKVQSLVTQAQWDRFTFHKGDIRDLSTCHHVCQNVDYVCQQAALGSVPRSIKDPFSSHDNNVTGFLNMLIAARDASVKSFTYASSSSVYGSNVDLPKIETQVGQALSPYALTKQINEHYANVFQHCYHFPSTALRYFNVFGPRQDPNGPYAAVIPKWISQMAQNKPVVIHGDDQISRDFCYIDNAVQANILSATTPHDHNRSFNVAVGEQTTLQTLYETLRDLLTPHYPELAQHQPIYGEPRAGDIKHSLADIHQAKTQLQYMPTHHITTGLKLLVSHFTQTTSKTT